MTRVLMGLLVSLSACAAPVGVRNATLPNDSAPRCAELCSQIGLPLDSVVIMAENVGCVCRAAPSPSTAPPGASASAGGMAAVMLAEEAARRRAAQQQQRNTYRPKY